MCPLRVVLVFLSATLAGYFAWRSVRSSPATRTTALATYDVAGVEQSPRDLKRGRCYHAKKVLGDGFWMFLDMASGRYLWRTIKERQLDENQNLVSEDD